jgi:hypothetical protein
MFTRRAFMILKMAVMTTLLLSIALLGLHSLSSPLRSQIVKAETGPDRNKILAATLLEDSGSAGFVQGSTTPLMQMTGDGLQLYSQAYKDTSGNLKSYWRICPTGTLVVGCDDINPTVPNTTMRDLGVQGGDEGSQVTMPDGTLTFLFGDTNLTWRDGATEHDIFYNRTVRGPDAIGYYPPDQARLDWSMCQYIENLDAALTNGQAPITASSAGCPMLQFYKSAYPGRPVAHYQNEQSMIGLSTTLSLFTMGEKYRENLGAGATPVGAFFVGKKLYQLYQDIPQIVNNGVECQPHLHLNAIVAKSTTPHTEWAQNRPPIFVKLYDYSQHGVVPNCQSPADTQAADPGKFIFNAPVVMSSNQLSSLGLLNRLPGSIRRAENFVFMFGASWFYRRSNVYLAVVADRDVDNGISRWWYLTGFDAARNPKWQRGRGTPLTNPAEKTAAPLFSSWNNARGNTPIVGEHSVRYIPAIQKFVLMYGTPAANGLFVRTSSTPWGPWSVETNIFGVNNNWALKLGRRQNTSITQNWPAMYDSPSATSPHVFADFGFGPYGPNLIDGNYTLNSDNTLTVYFTTSLFVPYQVYLMRAKFQLP